MNGDERRFTRRRGDAEEIAEKKDIDKFSVSSFSASPRLRVKRLSFFYHPSQQILRRPPPLPPTHTPPRFRRLRMTVINSCISLRTRSSIHRSASRARRPWRRDDRL